ncbi:MAG: hypothetical protein JRJ19_11740 [Deltaproteobacteria bacterium]|nr:hypothetical protein [Deltaproteobacteria bacterium]
MVFALALLVLGFVTVILLHSHGEDAAGREFHQVNGDETDVDKAARTDMGKQKKRKYRFTKIDRRTRAIILQKILMALQEKRQIETTDPAEKPRVPGTLHSRDIGKSINEINPLLEECYVMEMEDRGHVGGKVVMEISLVADDEYGGLVEEVNILESKLSRENSESFLECLRETLYAIRLEATEWVGRKTVKLYHNFYSF